MHWVALQRECMKFGDDGDVHIGSSYRYGGGVLLSTTACQMSTKCGSPVIMMVVLCSLVVGW